MYACSHVHCHVNANGECTQKGAMASIAKQVFFFRVFPSVSLGATSREMETEQSCFTTVWGVFSNECLGMHMS